MTRVGGSGVYVASGDRYSVAVPANWDLKETDEDLQVVSPSGRTAVIVTTFRANDSKLAVDSREHLRRYLKGAKIKGRTNIMTESKIRSEAAYKDPAGAFWEVVFVTDTRRLVLATCNSEHNAKPAERKKGRKILESIEISPTG